MVDRRVMLEKPGESSGFWEAVKAGVRLTHEAGPIKPAPVTKKPPLSFGQERLWQIDRMNPGNVGHNLRSAIRLRGHLDEDILKRSLGEIIGRHEVLRTTFGGGGDDGFQIISTNVCIDFATEDLNDIPVSRQEGEIRKLAGREARKPFDLTRGPLVRVRLLRLWEMNYILLRTIHHIVNDRWSDSLFMRELSAVYTAFKEGRPSPLKPLPIQYKDYAHFQRERMTGELLTSHTDYWKAHFSGNFPVLRLPEDAGEPKILSYRGASEYLVLDQAFSNRLESFCIDHGISLYVLLLSAFKTLLFRYSGQKTMILCSPVAGRSRPETKKLIGYFNNVLPMKTELADSLTFRELVERVGQGTTRAMAHQEIPLQHLADVLGIPGAVISRCMFAFQNVPNQPDKMADLALTQVDLEEGISNFDLSLSFKKNGKCLTGVMRYKTGLFTRETITGMLAVLKNILGLLTASPDIHLGELPMYGDEPACKPKKPRKGETLTLPRTEMEKTVAKVWMEVTGLSAVDINTSFFDLGGRSLGMVKICGRLQQILSREIPAMELLKAPTVKGIADYLSLNGVKEEINTRPIRDRRKMQKEAMKRRQKKAIRVRRR